MAIPNGAGAHGKEAAGFAVKRPSTALVAVGGMTLLTLVSKLLGMLRKILLADALGAGVEGDLFAAASALPLTLFDLTLAAAIGACLIPALSGKEAQEKQTRGRLLFCFLSITLSAAVLLSLLLALAAKPILSFFYPHFSQSQADMGARLLCIMAPGLIFCAASGIGTAILQAKKRFLLPALIGTFSSLSAIACLLLTPSSSKEARILLLAVAFTVGWALQGIIALGSGLKGETLRQGKAALMPSLFASALPALVCALLSPLLSLLGSITCARQTSGGAAIFDYASGLFFLLCGLAAHSITVYLFPHLAEADDNEKRAELTAKGVIACLTVSLPVSALVWFLADRGICILYLRGAFTAEAAREAAAVLKGAAPGIAAFSLIEWLLKCCFSRHLTLAPTLSALIGLGIGVLSMCLAPNAFAIGLSMTAAFGAFALCLWALMKRSREGALSGAQRMPVVKTGMAFLCGSLLLWGIDALPLKDPYTCTAAENLGLCLLSALPAILLYVLLLKACGVFDSLISRKEDSV